MSAKTTVRGLCLFIALLCGTWAFVQAQDPPTTPSSSQSFRSAAKDPQFSLDDDKLLEDAASKVEQAVIHPYQSANVGAEVSGVIKSIPFQEGDRVREGDVVAVLFKERDAALLKKAEEKVIGLQLELKRAEVDVKIKEELVSLGGATRQEFEKAVAEVEITRQRIKEAQEDLKIAEFNLKACEVKAPFSGYIAVRYKQPFETVDRLEKVFAILDSSKVFAVANIPETMLQRFPKDADAVFVHSAGKKFKGKVERSGKLIDPKSMTKRVYVLIDNAQDELEIGSSGTLESSE
jgi:RND family efflux transporter MFP subunit